MGWAMVLRISLTSDRVRSAAPTAARKASGWNGTKACSEIVVSAILRRRLRPAGESCGSSFCGVAVLGEALCWTDEPERDDSETAGDSRRTRSNPKPEYDGGGLIV